MQHYSTGPDAPFFGYLDLAGPPALRKTLPYAKAHRISNVDPGQHKAIGLCTSKGPVLKITGMSKDPSTLSPKQTVKGMDKDELFCI